MAKAARERLARLLAGEEAVAFSAQLSVPSDTLHLEVDGVGRVRLPVRPAQAKKLSGAARPAHFGHREETILDPAVRDTWEISPDLVSLGGPSWAPALEGALTELADELGVPAGNRLEAELHALLVYGPGQFFVPHQDTEKNDAMIGTLTAFEGRTCPLGAIGHPKDGVQGRLQIVYGLLTSKDGIPVAIEVFAGNTGDPATVASQVTKVKDRFGIGRVVLVGDRGMLTAARLREDVAPAHLDWITALRAPQVKKLVRGGDLQLTLFDVQDLAEITSPDFPGERLIACMNPFLQAERARKRESLLAATEADLAKIAAACARARQPLRGTDKIAVRADRVLNRRNVAKHFTVEITDDSIRYARDQDSIAAEAQLDGIYVLRTSVGPGDLDSSEVVSSYKALAQVERAFRAFNTDLDIRPIRHRTEDRVRAHVFLRMLSYYITWHMNDRLARVLFTDDDKPAARAARSSPVAPAARSPKVLAKAAAKHTGDHLPVHSLASLLTDLGTICLNEIQPADPALPGFRLVNTPTAPQRQALELLGVSHRLGVS
jgi:hypothetical protein